MSDEQILMVEDDPLVLSVITTKLRAQGYQVTGIASVGDAIQATASALPDLLILDLTILDADPFSGLTDGFAFLRLLQRNHPGVDLPVIIYSVDDSPTVQAKAKSLGVAAVLNKAAPVSELLTVVRLVLDERNAQLAAAAPPAVGDPVPATDDCGGQQSL